jgi:hypothetical protein
MHETKQMYSSFSVWLVCVATLVKNGINQLSKRGGHQLAEACQGWSLAAASRPRPEELQPKNHQIKTDISVRRRI